MQILVTSSIISRANMHTSRFLCVNINRDLFFELDDGGRRGHEKKLSKEDFVWILENLFLVTG